MIPVFWWAISALLILAGVVSSFLPVSPGVFLVFAGMLLGAWADGFRHIGWVTLLILGLLALVALLGDMLGSLIGAKRLGASRAALIGAAIGILVGIFFGLPGALLGPFLGATAGELLARRHVRQSVRVGAGTWVGLAFSVVLRLIIVFTMLAVFITRCLL
jgi:uncharacterized protein YqgC (DUF456 family)